MEGSKLSSILSNTTERVFGRPNVHQITEAMQRFGLSDYLVFTFMLIICIIIGIYFGFYKVSKTHLDYLIGGRNMKVFPVGLSLIASFVSGISLLGIPTEVYLYGLQFMYILIGLVLMAFIFQFVYLPVFMELKVTTTFEYLERRFNRYVRILGSVLCIIGTCIWLPIVIYVPALAFNQVTGINIHFITPIVCVICIFYTSLGGLKAVVWTDVIQSIIMIGTIIFIAVKGTIDVGGLETVMQRNLKSGRLDIPDIDPNPFSRYTLWSLSIGGTIYYLQTTAIDQPMIQRYLSLPNYKDAKKALWIFVGGLIILLSTLCYCGLLIYATYQKCDPIKTKLAKQKDQLLPILVMDVVGNVPGIPGLFIAGIFSAALSSLSTGLNSLVAIILQDFYRPLFKNELTERHKQIMMKTTTVILGVIFVGLVFVVERMGTVLQLTMGIGTIGAGPSLALFTMGLLLPWVNATGALIGSITGLIFMGWLILTAQMHINNGDIFFHEKRVSVRDCHYDFEFTTEKPFPKNITHWSDLMFRTETPYARSEVLTLFRLSYLWYTLLGMLVSCVVGLLVSILGVGGGILDPRDVDPLLLAPVIRKRIKPRQFPNQPPAQDAIILAYESKTYKSHSSSNSVSNFVNITSEL